MIRKLKMTSTQDDREGGGRGRSRTSGAVLLGTLMILGFMATVWSVQGSARTRLRKGPKAYLFRPLGTRTVLASAHADDVRSIASLTKLMATLVICEHHLNLDRVTTMSRVDKKVAAGGCRSRLLLGAKYRNRDLLYAALLASDNSAVAALGRAVGLDASVLVEAMNRRVVAMGLRHTNFSDPVGITPANVSTAREVSYMLEAAMKNSILKAVMKTPEHYVTAVWPRRNHINYLSTNLFLFRRKYHVYGGKTGFNHVAGYCLATAVRVRGLRRPVIGVVLGSRSKLARFGDYARILSSITGGSTGARSRRVVRARHVRSLR
ncbi:MAG: D-alanyl-D-alanine carboxypeptidase [Deltaproteobacteria bacterium]|nr:D-alanyl-D-alanine carboxypeptidase [Deltaproteobacteria bacterium]